MLVELTDLAKSDIKSILDYTEGRWGESKRINTRVCSMTVYKT